MARAIALIVVLVHGVAFAASTRLQVTSRPLRDTARLTYASSDALAGLDKGPGQDPSSVSVEVFLKQGAVTTRFEIPAGAYAGRAGWIANDASRALYVNRDAPTGPTATMKTLFAPGRRVMLVTKSLGDANPLDLAAAPSTPVEVAYVVTNGGETHAHCVEFARCTYTPIDAGSGWKLRCDGGVADLACGARPICGNGVREHGEECDGGFGCTADCRQQLYSCCQGAGECVAAPVFSLQYYLMQYCSINAGDPRPGEVCEADGSCADEAIETVPVCCQQSPTTCYQQSESSVAGLWYDQYYCLQGSGIGGPIHIVIGGICGADGACVAE